MRRRAAGLERDADGAGDRGQPGSENRGTSLPASAGVLGMSYSDRLNVLQREGEYWTIIYAGALCRLRDCAGLRQLAMLLARPGDRIPAVRLAAIWGDQPPPEAIATDKPAEQRARVNVTRALRAALAKISGHHPGLFAHLDATIRTGAHCSYHPRAPISWML